jgi:hypothetical protein
MKSRTTSFSMNILLICFMIYSHLLFANSLNIKQTTNVAPGNPAEEPDDQPEQQLQNKNSKNDTFLQTNSNQLTNNTHVEREIEKSFEEVYKFVDHMLSTHHHKQIEQGIKVVNDLKSLNIACNKIEKELQKLPKIKEANENIKKKLSEPLASILTLQLRKIEKAIKNVEKSVDGIYIEIIEELKGLVESKIYNKENEHLTKILPPIIMSLEKKLSEFKEVVKKLENVKNLILDTLIGKLLAHRQKNKETGNSDATYTSSEDSKKEIQVSQQARQADNSLHNNQNNNSTLVGSNQDDQTVTAESFIFKSNKEESKDKNEKQSITDYIVEKKLKNFESKVAGLKQLELKKNSNLRDSKPENVPEVPKKNEQTIPTAPSKNQTETPQENNQQSTSPKPGLILI